MVTIRGAITVSENTSEAILEGTELLLREILTKNTLKDDEIISIFFSATKDLDAVYPAVAARNMGINEASLLCLQEMYVEGSLMKCVRILIHVERDQRQKDVQHVFLRDAARLRPDLSETGVE